MIDFLRGVLAGCIPLLLLLLSFGQFINLIRVQNTKKKESGCRSVGFDHLLNLDPTCGQVEDVRLQRPQEIDRHSVVL